MPQSVLPTASQFGTPADVFGDEPSGSQFGADLDLDLDLDLGDDGAPPSGLTPLASTQVLPRPWGSSTRTGMSLAWGAAVATRPVSISAQVPGSGTAAVWKSLSSRPWPSP